VGLVAKAIQGVANGKQALCYFDPGRAGSAPAALPIFNPPVSNGGSGAVDQPPLKMK
jgi:hypothetical protein